MGHQKLIKNFLIRVKKLSSCYAERHELGECLSKLLLYYLLALKLTLGTQSLVLVGWSSVYNLQPTAANC